MEFKAGSCFPSYHTRRSRATAAPRNRGQTAKKHPTAGGARDPTSAGAHAHPHGGGLDTPPYGMRLPCAHPTSKAKAVASASGK